MRRSPEGGFDASLEEVFSTSFPISSDRSPYHAWRATTGGDKSHPRHHPRWQESHWNEVKHETLKVCQNVTSFTIAVHEKNSLFPVDIEV